MRKKMRDEEIKRWCLLWRRRNGEKNKQENDKHENKTSSTEQQQHHITTEIRLASSQRRTTHRISSLTSIQDFNMNIRLFFKTSHTTHKSMIGSDYQIRSKCFFFLFHEKLQAVWRSSQRKHYSCNISKKMMQNDFLVDLLSRSWRICSRSRSVKRCLLEIQCINCDLQ